MRQFWALLCAFFVTLAPCFAQGAEPPAAVSELAQKGVSLKVEFVTPEKGLQTNIADLLRDKQSAKILENLHMFKRGVWTSRGTGYAKERAGQFTGTFSEMGSHTTSAGVNRLVFAMSGKVYSYDLSTSTETEIHNGTITDPCIRSFNAATMMMTRGSNGNPLKWNGNPASAMSGMGGWPITSGTRTFEQPTFCEVFANRAVFAGMTSEPFTVVLSDFNAPETFTFGGSATNGGFFDVPSQLGKITGLRTLRLQNDNTDQVLIVGCERGMAMITGYSGSTFALKDLTREYGLASNRAWVQLQNDLLFMATDGIRKFSQTVSSANLLNSSITFGVQNLVNTLNYGQKKNIFAMVHAATQEVYFWIPYTGDAVAGPAYRAFVLNYNTDETREDGSINPIISTKLLGSNASAYDGMKCGIEFDTGSTRRFLMASSDSYLHEFYTGLDTMNGNAIHWKYLSPLVGANSPAQNQSLRKVIVITEGATQKFDMASYTFDTVGSGTTEWKARDTKAFNVSGSAATYPSTWSGSSGITSYPKLLDFFSKGSGRYWAFYLTGDATDEHIDLVGLQVITTVGGWKQ